jgi:hypothetical protein
VENIPIVFEEKVISNINVADKIFDPYGTDSAFDVNNPKYEREALVTFMDGTSRMMQLSWNLSGINVNYAGSERYYAVARIGNANAGYQTQSVPVSIIDRELFLESLELQNLTRVFDPFNPEYDPSDESNYPSVLTVTFKDSSTMSFDVSWNLSDISLDFSGGTKYAKATIGTGYGGFQTIDVPIIILDRTVVTISLETYEFNPYTDDAKDKSHYPTNPVVYYAGCDPEATPVTWDLSGIQQTYIGGTFYAKAIIGTKQSGYQSISVKVVILPKIVKETLIAPYEFDPYEALSPLDANNYADSLQVIFEDGTNYTFDDIKWDLSELSPYVNFAGTGDNEVYAIARVGTMIGTFQYIYVPVTIRCREIQELLLNDGNQFLFDPYSGTDPRYLSSYPTEVYALLTNGDLDYVNATWVINEVIDGYKGYLSDPEEEFTVYCVVGNTAAGYQRFPVTVRVLNRVVQSVTPNKFILDPYDVPTFPSTIVVTFLDENGDPETKVVNVTWVNSTINLGINKPGYVYPEDGYTIDARIGDNIGSYQLITVPVELVDKERTEIIAGGQTIWNSEWTPEEMTTYVIDPLGGRDELPEVVTVKFSDGTNQTFDALGISLRLASVIQAEATAQYLAWVMQESVI